jgi:hypothetical protein
MALVPEPQNQEGNIFTKAATKIMINNAPKVAKNIIKRKATTKNNMPENAIEQTW